MLKVGFDSLFMDKGCIFQKLDRIYNKYVVSKYNENFYENYSQAWVNKWSTPTHQSTTIQCMQGQDIQNFLIGIRFKTCIMDI